MPRSALGLHSWIWANNFKSTLLLLSFPFLLALLFWLGAYVYAWLSLPLPNDVAMRNFYDPYALKGAWELTWQYGPMIFGAAAAWMVIATLFNSFLVNMATGARGVSRAEEPALYNLVENLCISRGLPVPKLQVIETGELNAYASGLSPSSFTITVTRGIMQALSADELEGVLAHELTHIINRDVRLLVITTVFVGMISFLSQLAWRSMSGGMFGMQRYTHQPQQQGRRATPLWLIAAVLLFIGYILALILRFAISRRREYLADAGAVELTKNPDALARALRKIAGRADMAHVPPEVKQMFIENAPGFFGQIFGLFATHPPIEKRIAILEGLAGYRGLPPSRGSVPTASDL